MLLLILALFQFICPVVSVGIDDLPPLNRVDLLQFMHSAVKKRYTEDIVRDVYNSVVEDAKQGKGQFVLEFTGCDNSNAEISEELCKSIVNDVFTIVQVKFPDSLVSYNIESKEFKLSWTQ